MGTSLFNRSQGFSYTLRIQDHHVHVEEGRRDLGPEALDDGRPEGQVGHEVSVHHVEVEVVGAVVQQPLRF